MAVMDAARYLPHLLSLEDAERRAGQERAAEARRRLPRVVDLLVRELGATRVVLFGSLLDGTLAESSDVDLAVEGLDRARYWEALWRCSDALGRAVDLVPLEDARPSLRERVRDEGEVLHG